MIKEKINELVFADLFSDRTVLVPAPKSSPIAPGTLWVPKLFANELVKVGLGKCVESYLERTRAVTKSSTAGSMGKPRAKAVEHYDSMTVKETVIEPSEILVIDDVITRGATLLGAINKLADAFPNSKIRGFALVRTISNSDEFKKLEDPCMGTITLIDDQTFRRP